MRQLAGADTSLARCRPPRPGGGQRCRTTLDPCCCQSRRSPRRTRRGLERHRDNARHRRPRRWRRCGRTGSRRREDIPAQPTRAQHQGAHKCGQPHGVTRGRCGAPTRIGKTPFHAHAQRDPVGSGHAPCRHGRPLGDCRRPLIGICAQPPSVQALQRGGCSTSLVRPQPRALMATDGPRCGRGGAGRGRWRCRATARTGEVGGGDRYVVHQHGQRGSMDRQVSREERVQARATGCGSRSQHAQAAAHAMRIPRSVQVRAPQPLRVSVHSLGAARPR